MCLESGTAAMSEKISEVSILLKREPHSVDFESAQIALPVWSAMSTVTFFSDSNLALKILLVGPLFERIP